MATINLNKATSLVNGKLIIKLALAACSYLLVLIFIPLIFSIFRKNQFIIFHLRQGASLLIFWVILAFSFYIPILFWIATVVVLTYIIIGISNVIMQKEKHLPLIGKLAL